MTGTNSPAAGYGGRVQTAHAVPRARTALAQGVGIDPDQAVTDEESCALKSMLTISLGNAAYFAGITLLSGEAIGMQSWVTQARFLRIPMD